MNKEVRTFRIYSGFFVFKNNIEMISEKEYLKALKTVKNYRNQIIEDVRKVECLGSTREVVQERFLIDKNFNRVHLAKEIGVSRKTIQRYIKEIKSL